MVTCSVWIRSLRRGLTVQYSTRPTFFPSDASSSCFTRTKSNRLACGASCTKMSMSLTSVVSCRAADSKMPALKISCRFRIGSTFFFISSMSKRGRLPLLSVFCYFNLYKHIPSYQDLGILPLGVNFCPSCSTNPASEFLQKV